MPDFLSKSQPVPEYLVIGDPVGHSRSPGMQNAAFAAAGLGRPYGRRQVTAAELPDFIALARQVCRGVNVTVPHKRAMLKLTDRLDPAAAVCGSVNTLVIRDGVITGFSTDGYGLEQALRHEFDLTAAGKRFLCLGAGGAARAVLFHLAERGVQSIVVANRTLAHAKTLAEDLHRFRAQLEVNAIALDDFAALRKSLQTADALVQASALGLRPDDPPPFPETLLDNAQCAVFDMVYHETALQRAARSRGLPAAGGKWMLIYQGARSFELWTGVVPDVAAMARGFEEEQPL